MNLYRIGDRHPNYPDTLFNGRDLKGLDVYSAEGHNMGSVYDLLVDEAGQLQYLVIGSKARHRLLLPISYCSDVADQSRVQVHSLNRHEFGRLPEYDDSQLKEVGQALQLYTMEPLERSHSVESTAPVDSLGTAQAPTAYATTNPFQQQTNRVQLEDPVPKNRASENRPIQLFEERLFTQKQRVKTGEIKISKHTVTGTDYADVPVTKEKIIIEIESIYGSDTRLDIGDAEVGEDGSMRMGIYEDQVEVCRRIVPYQTVSVRKEVVSDVVKAQETLRREELSISSDGAPYSDVTLSDSGRL
ncbi:MAG: hypothetical protein DCF15_03625 [Phormidesmis priestleyi]|uniref:Photosystem reaction center subunit H n=1 Tax=Phormidesmis priestleyi TaxID=268141 RepID=A0A2W4ZLV8_9CYAN|nr:MAG: hypothetical protein DCF15_03625 [Phormidesmis priestleyi]